MDELGLDPSRTAGQVADDALETVFVSPRELGYKPYVKMLKTLQAKYGFYKVLNNPDIQIIDPALGRAVYYERTRHNGIYVVSPMQLYLDLKSRNHDVEIPTTLTEFLEGQFQLRSGLTRGMILHSKKRG